MRVSRKAGLLGIKLGGEPIDIGNPAIIQSSFSSGGYTKILADNPANASGKITTVQIYTSNDVSGIVVAIFVPTGTNTFSTRDYVSLGYTKGTVYHEITVDLDVQAGDLIGVYYPANTIHGISTNASGGAGYWRTSGNCIPCTNQSFGEKISTTGLMSLYGIGTT